MRNVALDLGTRKISFCEVANGQVTERATVRDLNGLLALIGPNTSPAAVAIEACREAWFVHAKLQAWGQHPILVDTTRTKLIGIGQHGRKTDKIDAEALARALEEGRIPRAHVLSPARQALRFQLSVRRALVETRSQYITSIRGLARARGVLLPSCDSANFVSHLQRSKLGEETRALVMPLVGILERIEHELEIVHAKLEKLCLEEPTVQRLATAPGVGPVTAAAYVSVIDDARRFRNAHQVESYVGLVPGEESTGLRRRIGAITKAGNRYLRSMLVEAGWNILRIRDPNDPLKLWGQAVAQRRGKRIAAVALARRLAGVLWALWRDETVYEPAKLAVSSAAGTATQAAVLNAHAQRLARAGKKISRGFYVNRSKSGGNRTD